MALASIEKERVRDLAEGRVKPATGMEIHFLKAINGQAIACTPKEREWLDYWNNVRQGSDVRVEGKAEEHKKVALLDNASSAISETKRNVPVKKKASSGKKKLARKEKIATRKEKTHPAKKNSIAQRIKSEITEIEGRTDISDEQKVSRITHITCATCAGIAVQPIPFADIFILTPVQAYFGTRIAAIRGVPVSESEVLDLIKEIIGIVGMGIIAQQLAIGVWKMVTGGLGGFLTVPLVYGLSYAVMNVIDAYYIAKAKKSKLSEAQMKKIWKKAFREGKAKYETESSKEDA